MRFALDLGGGDASTLLARQYPRRPARHVQQLGHCSMALWGGALLCDEGAMLAVLGNPLPPATALPPTVAEARATMSTWDGAFAAAYWSLREERLVVTSDFLGLFPLYFQRHEAGLRLATQTQAFRDAQPHAEGWGSFVALGFTLGDTTLCRSVTRFPAGQALTFDAHGNCVDERSTWAYPAPAPHADVGRILQAARDSRDRYIEHADSEESTLLLSGGFDSRFIGCLLVEAGRRPLALTVENQGEKANTEGLVARRVAEALGLPVQTHRPDPNFYSSRAYLDYVASTDGATPSLGLFIAELAQFLTSESPIWEGLLPGATLVNLHNPGGGFRTWHEREGEGRADVWRAAEALFVPEFVDELRESFRQLWRSEVEKYRNDAHGVAEFVLRNRSRHRTAINPLKVFNIDRPVHLLGATRDFVEAAQSAPFQGKADFKLYFRLFDEFANVRNIPYFSGGNLASTRAGAVQTARLAWRIRVHEWFARRPRIARRLRLPLPTPYFAPSRFVEPHMLADLDDPLIRRDTKPLSPALAQEVGKLAFHWIAWKSLHEGDLHARFDAS